MTDKTTTTITLSERPPVEIDPDAWPIIAESYWHDGEVECQANRRRSIEVRRHADGRHIVYGWRSSNFQGERGAEAGWLLDADASDDVVSTIRRVGGVLGDARLADECIADLPAERLD